MSQHGGAFPAAGALDDGYVLIHYWDVLKRRWRVVAVAVMVGALVASAYAFTRPTRYRASAEILVVVPPERSTAAATRSAAAEVATELAIIRSAEVREAAEARAGRRIPVSVTQSESGAPVAVVSARGPTGAAAREGAQAYAEAYVDRRVNEGLAAAEVSRGTIAASVEDLDQRLAALAVQVAEFDNRIATTPDAAGRASLQNQREDLVLDRRDLTAQRTRLQEELATLDAEVAADPTFGVRILAPAGEASPIGAPAAQVVVAGTMLGAVLGAGAAFARDHLDDSVHSAAEVAASTGGPVLAVVPAGPGGPEADDEAYRALRTRLQLAVPGRGAVVAVASPRRGDGRTTVAARLACSMAGLSRPVVVVDADAHRPGLHRALAIPNPAAGLSSVLSGQAEVAQAVQAVPGHANLRLLAAGPAPADAAALMSTDRARDVFAAATRQGVLVVADSAPLLDAPEGLVMARLADAVLLVARAGWTTRSDLRSAAALLDQAGATLVGSVLLGADGRG